MKNSTNSSMKETAVQSFWRDEALPFIEARSVEDGREVCYGKHAHEAFSIGAVTGGRSTYINGKTLERAGPGSVVVINPEVVHACNPDDDQPWSYRMLYVDVGWLSNLQRELGASQSPGFRPFSTTLTTQVGLYDGLNRLHAALIDEHSDVLQKHSAAIEFFSDVCRTLSPAPISTGGDNLKPIKGRDDFTDALKAMKQASGQYGAISANTADPATTWRWFMTLYSGLAGPIVSDQGTRVTIDAAWTAWRFVRPGALWASAASGMLPRTMQTRRSVVPPGRDAAA